MLIGELARRCGLSVRTLRFYADVGVLAEEGRTGSGWAPTQAPADIVDAWKWYARALRAHV